MDRITSPHASSSTEELHANEHHSVSPVTSDTIKKLSPPKMRQSEQSVDQSVIVPADSPRGRHQMGSVSSKRLAKEKSEENDAATLSATLKSMSANSLIDALMNFNTVNHDDKIVQWESWLQSHGVCHALIRQLQLQAEFINVLGLTLSAPSSTKEAVGTSSSPTVTDSRQRRQLCTHMLSGLEQAQSFILLYAEKFDVPDSAKSATQKLIQEQVIFFADVAKAAHLDQSKLFKYQLPKVLSSAIWPEKMDEQKLKINLESMGLFVILSDIMVSIVKIARQARTQSMAGMQEDVQLLIKQTLQADLSDLALAAIKQATTYLLMQAEQRGHAFQISRYLLTQFYALFDQQLDGIRQAFGLPLKY
jgi:hypothetical protein